MIRDVAYDDGSRLAQVVDCIQHLLSPFARGLSGKTVAAQFDNWEHLTPFTIPALMASDLWTARRINQLPAEDASDGQALTLPLKSICSRPSGPSRRLPRDGRVRRFRGATHRT